MKLVELNRQSRDRSAFIWSVERAQKALTITQNNKKLQIRIYKC